MFEPQPHQPDTRERLIVAAYEDGLLQARVARSTQPVEQATHMLLTLLDQRSQGARP